MMAARVAKPRRSRRAFARTLGFALAFALASNVASPSPARSQAAEEPLTAQLVHQVRKGDTLELLAAEYYGDRQLAVFIMVENGMAHPRPLRPGETLKIPTAWKYRAVAGDTIPKLAERFLGDARRATYLADFNRMPADAVLVEGQPITVPFHVTHVAANRETLASIAAAFYGDSSKAELLRGYNFKSGRLLKKGEAVIVPIVHVRVRESKLPIPDPDTLEREQRIREETQRAREALTRAREAWSEGDYAQVKRGLATLDLQTLEAEAAADVAFLLGAAYVAFGDEDSALAHFKKALERRPDFSVRADEVSPKVRRVWERAGGKSVAP